MHTTGSRRANWRRDCDAQRPPYISGGTDKHSCGRSEQMDCSRAGWTVDCHFGPSSSRRQKVARFETVLGEKTRIHERGTETPSDLGWRFRCELVRIDRFSLRGRVDTKTENTDGHKAILLLARALHAALAKLAWAVRNTRMDAEPIGNLEQKLNVRKGTADLLDGRETDQQRSSPADDGSTETLRASRKNPRRKTSRCRTMVWMVWMALPS